MEKALKILAGMGLLAVLVSPMVVGAQERVKECCVMRRDVTLEDVGTCAKDTIAAPDDTAAGDCGTGTSCTVATADTWGLFCLMSTIYYVTDWIFTILLLVAVIMMIYGGFTMLTAMGAEESFTRGRNIIMYAVAGVGVAVVARLIPAIVRAIIGI